MSTKTKSKTTPDPLLAGVHIGEILSEDYLRPMNITPYRLAKDIGVTPTRVSEILKGRREVTIDTALRLARYFGTSAAFWLSMQAECQLRNSQELAEKIEKEVKPAATAA
jgi:addiction module HigA family antidote